MSAVDAVYRLAHRYPGGIPALAARMRRNPDSLQNKINPNQAGAHVYIQEAEEMTAFSGDPEIAQAMAMACGHVCIPVPPTGGEGEFATEIAAVGKEFGDVMEATVKAIDDGRVTSRELAEYDRQFNELLAAAVRLRAQLVKLVPKPPEQAR